MFEEFLIPLKISIKVTIVAGFIVIILGTIAGRILSMKSFKGKTLLETILMLPLVLPPTVVGFLLLVIFGRQSFVGKMIQWVFNQPIVFTWWAAVIASIIVAFPLMYQSAKTGFQSVDNEIEEAARVCGANEWNVFFLISIPLSIKAIISGSILSVARVLGEFGATLMFAGNIPGKTQTVPTAIYLAIDAGNMKMAWLWVLSMVAISFIMLFVVQLKQK
ncbi:molybdate ABC transporter permease subunit [Bacillus sp. AFS077874]|uniref:molybdate ABC transporter permease subunit n=1 Tax=unclassified Bacillus (in: firmicutes) TaxID=185979 RepID=UPI000BEDF3F1|nr:MULTISPECIES: molybdate ABC transporter permease subunit [unclassified Bacillus (in: firmicutes)]PEC51108.1 molybdate ABC transporter permease subunit [Bacillus sp. AFS096315]PFM81275.1 molybdate ABC transporter permease subunit [Bacillus sp. AFS077874]